MTITCTFSNNIYRRVEPVLYNRFMAFVRQTKKENYYIMRIDCCDFDALSVEKYLKSQPECLSIEKKC